MRDPKKQKARDLRRIARSQHSPSIFDLFDKYHDLTEWAESSAFSPEWRAYLNLQFEWAIKIAGYWNAIYVVRSKYPSRMRKVFNRLRRTQEKQSLQKAIRDDALEEYVVPLYRKTGRYW